MLSKNKIVGTVGVVLAVAVIAISKPAWPHPTLWQVGKSGLTVAVVYLCAAIYMEFCAPLFGDRYPAWLVLSFLGIGTGFSIMYSGVVVPTWPVLEMHFIGVQVVGFVGLFSWIYLSYRPPKTCRR